MDRLERDLFSLSLPILFLLGPMLLHDSKNVVIIIPALYLVSLAYRIIVIWDSIRTARITSPEFLLKKYNKIPIYIGLMSFVFIIYIGLTAFIKNNYLQAYRIPAASMEPTLIIGDKILVDRHSSGRIPNRGDLIVFEYPRATNVDLIKRVVAIGGDTVEVRNKFLLMNGQEVTEPNVVHRDPNVIPERDNFGPVKVPDVKSLSWAITGIRVLTVDSGVSLISQK
ncbi:MAG: signal peptidase I [Nitrospirae bacterium]|nr:signal peptidase I [Nitrospirota bacterium]